MEIEKELGRIMSGYQQAMVLFTANNLKIFDEITNDPVTAEHISLALKLSTKGVERLMNALVAMDMATKRGNRFMLNEPWAPYLTRNGERSAQQWIQLSSDLMPAWLELPRFVEKGKNVRSIMEMLGSDPENMWAFIDAMHIKGLKATWMIARELPIGDATNMLDLGGGPGTYALEWAKLHQHLKATVFDIPPVLEVAKDYIKRYGLENRVGTMPGDFHKDDIGKGYDLVLMANILHMYDEDHGKELIKKAADALHPGGRLIVHGFSTEEDETGPLQDVLFSLNMGLITESGRAHTVTEKIQWIEDAGMIEVRGFRVDAMPTCVVTGIKPL